MRYIRFLVLLIFAALIIGAGCTPTVTIRRMVPAKYHITGVKEVTFAPFSYSTTYHERGSTIIPDILEQVLTKNGFFDVVESPDISLKMDEELSAARLRKIGRGAGADAVITGEVMAFQVTVDRREIPVEEEVETGRYRTERYEEGGQVKYRRVPITETVTYYETSLEKAAEVSFYADLVSTPTGKTLDHNYYTKIGTEKAQGSAEIRRMSSDDKMLRGVAEKLASKFVRHMTPHEVTQKIAFKSEKPCKEGIKLAKDGRWDEAGASWNSALASDPNCPCANYNLGLSHEVKKEYPQALSFYQRAADLVPQEMLYARAVKRVKNIIKGEKILEQQMRGR